MQARQPMQLVALRSTMPSRRLKSALVGQIRTHGASLHWLHSTGKKSRRVAGNDPFSTVLTQQRFTPTGISCSDLQAMVQAWHPMHFRRSIANPKLAIEPLDY